MKQSIAACARLLAAITLMTLLVSPVARSQPPEELGVSVAPTLPLVELGAVPQLAFYGTQGTESLEIPVPPGLNPVALTAITQLPVNVRSAAITVMQDDRTIGRVEMPPGESAPVVIPLEGVRVVDNAAHVMLRTYLIPLDGYCLDPSNPLRLSEAGVTFAGVEHVPTAVADFLPPVLRQLSIFVDDDPSRAETNAAVRLATAVAAHYGTQNPGIELLPLRDGQLLPEAPSAPLQRHIVIREDAEAGVSLRGTGGVPALLVAGPAEELGNQSRLLTSDLNRLAIASKAVAGPLSSTPQLPGDQTTLRRLGQPGVNATAMSPQVSIGLDQTRLGRSVRDVRVHLRGDYTPLPGSVAGQLVASIGGETVDRWPADATGDIDRWVDVPDHLMERYTSLGVRLDISGNTGRCGEFQPLTLTIDGDSPVHSRLAEPPVRGGFQSLPQALLPRAAVGVDGGFDDARRAVVLLAGLQRLSALPIDTAVMSVREAIDAAGPAVLVSAAGWTDERITLPVTAGADGEISVERPDPPDGTQVASTLELDPGLAWGSLQTVYDGERSVLIATSNNAPERLDALLGWLGNDVQRWSSLSGTALIAAPDREPVLISTAPSVPAAAAATADRSSLYLGLATALGVLLVAAAGVVIYRRSRHSEGRP
ncbi:hypothetical protein [[Mycobacterium] burgundiense]|uniref:Cellulose synthase subunit n=1 Tax=[Mycobacterium] burgundiense TaxID=3064286 RepID=A0ABN9NQW3_9MYCO|nr:hypothetical protein [Mycolicibacterium sp. MU0053]CAJ1508332.1 hypothetical protein MU0053_003811 [Mycolicibacterium sp. MU0053]